MESCRTRSDAGSKVVFGDTPPRIAFVLSSLGAGGTEGVVAKVSERLAADGADVSVVAFDSLDDPVFHRFDPRVRLVRLGLPPVSGRYKAAVNGLRRIKRLRDTMRRERIDVIVSFLTKINALSLAASLGLGTAVIVSERNNPLVQPHHPFWRVALRLLYPRASSVVLPTRGSLACLPRAARDRAVIIHNPVVATRHVAGGSELNRCVGVGRLTHQKGFDLLIDAFEMLADRFPDWELVIWGDGPDRASLRQQIEDLGLQERVTLAGTSPEPGSWIETASMLALSSRYEGSPNVVIEAMAAGIPVVSARCDFGPSELIEDGRDGLLVPTEDSRALADAMARMMADPALRARLGSAGQTRIMAEASLETITRQWREVIRTALDRPTAESAVMASQGSPTTAPSM